MQKQEPVFNYNSIYKYSKVLTDEQLFCGNGDEGEEGSDKPADYPLVNLFVHKLIVFIFYTLFIITFPISAFFCIQRIHSLQRCLVYRLGFRLPLKGPGIIIKFPLIDCIEIIDLSDYEFVLVDKSQQLLTSDGSIIEFNSVLCCLNITNAVRSSTQLKDSKFNVKQFCQLSFVNMIAGTHVEDWENKIEPIVKDFEQNCNIYLNNWGYNCKFKQLPKFVIISRANPINPIVYKLKSMFSGEQTEPNGILNELKKLQTNSGQNSDLKTNDSEIVTSLQSMAEKYRNYVFHDINIAIQVLESNSNDYYIFHHLSGEVNKVTEKPNKVNINISADTSEALMRFCRNKDMNCVRITTNLI